MSGDFYNFVNIESESLQGLVIADISGKGMPAALFTALARSTIRASLTTACCPADWVTHANRVLRKDTVNGMFVTLCYAQVAPETDEMIYTNAGHNPSLWFHQAEQTFTPLGRTGIAFGVDQDHHFHQKSIHLEQNDFICFRPEIPGSGRVRKWHPPAGRKDLPKRRPPGLAARHLRVYMLPT